MRLQSVSICAVCDRLGHVSKLCPDTKVGNRRLAESQADESARLQVERIYAMGEETRG
jgi:hypothetical protein